MTRADWRPARRENIHSQIPKQGKARREKVRLLRKGRGQITSIPAEIVAAHVAYLRSIGFSTGAIATAAGVSDTTVQRISRGEYVSSNLIPGMRIRAVGHIPVPSQSGTLVPGIGTQRRIHALNAIGWPCHALGRHLGVSDSQVHYYARNRPVQYATWAAVREMYEKLSGEPGPSPQSITRCRTRGYAPPIAWEGIDIDHPDSMPDLGGVGAEEVDPVLLTRILHGEHDGDVPKLERAEVINYAIEHGWGATRLSAVLGIEYDAADAALVRRRRKLRQAAA